jgi:leucyl/phenylalanyl-tRNA--protein transferase
VIDCQVYTEHLAGFGATEWPRTRFLALLDQLVRQPTRSGPWRFDSGFDGAHDRRAA